MNCILQDIDFVDRSKIQPLESMVQRVVSIGNSDSIIWSSELFALLFFSRNCFFLFSKQTTLAATALHGTCCVCKTSAAAVLLRLFLLLLLLLPNPISPKTGEKQKQAQKPKELGNAASLTGFSSGLTQNLKT